MKRAFLIAGGTVGGLGAVLAITPPQLGDNSSSIGGGIPLTPSTTSATPTAAASAAATKNPQPAATKSAKPSAGATAKPTAAATTKPTAAASASATAVATQPGSSKATTGIFVGDASTMRYGTVQVQITIANGKIIDAQAIRTPTGENQRYTDRAVPVMRQKTLAAQSSNISGVSGASYTAYAWYVSLQSALKKAGWM
jgi:uncharacterized protein with FMN-binding domain